jgi:hypothetical protein
LTGPEPNVDPVGAVEEGVLLVRAEGNCRLQIADRRFPDGRGR